METSRKEKNEEIFFASFATLAVKGF